MDFESENDWAQKLTRQSHQMAFVREIVFSCSQIVASIHCNPTMHGYAGHGLTLASVVGY
jgi:hypothetical protein